MPSSVEAQPPRIFAPERPLRRRGQVRRGAVHRPPCTTRGFLPASIQAMKATDLSGEVYVAQSTRKRCRPAASYRGTPVAGSQRCRRQPGAPFACFLCASWSGEVNPDTRPRAVIDKVCLRSVASRGRQVAVLGPARRRRSRRRRGLQSTSKLSDGRSAWVVVTGNCAAEFAVCRGDAP